MKDASRTGADETPSARGGVWRPASCTRFAERFPLSEAGRAHEVLERGGHAGKVVLVCGERKEDWGG
jgi:hypothetical protein